VQASDINNNNNKNNKREASWKNILMRCSKWIYKKVMYYEEILKWDAVKYM
jgi:hypothetical protein